MFKINKYERKLSRRISDPRDSSLSEDKVIQVSFIYNFIRSIGFRLKTDFSFQIFMYFSNDFMVITLELLQSYKSFESGQSLLSTVYYFYDASLRLIRIFVIVAACSGIQKQVSLYLTILFLKIKT